MQCHVSTFARSVGGKWCVRSASVKVLHSERRKLSCKLPLSTAQSGAETVPLHILFATAYLTRGSAVTEIMSLEWTSSHFASAFTGLRTVHAREQRDALQQAIHATSIQTQTGTAGTFMSFHHTVAEP